MNSPGAKSLFGKEIRKSIIAEEGNVIVGADMKSAQLSIAAYYANNNEYYQNVATGIEEDDQGNYVGLTAHCVNARMFGKVTEAEWKRAVDTQDKALIEKLTLIRGKNKGGAFTVIFGGSGKKVAQTIDLPEKEGHAIKERFLNQMGLDNTITELKNYESKYPHKGGFMLPLALGYWLWNNSSHKSLNTVVQGFEALAQKLAVIRSSRQLDREGLSQYAKKILDVHDEMLYEVKKEYVDKVVPIIRESYTWAAEQIFEYHVSNPDQFANPNPPKFSIDLDGGAKVGENYYDVH